MFGKVCLSVFGLLATSNASADWVLNMSRGVTELSAETYDLHMQVLYSCCAIGVLVFGAMIVSLIAEER